MRLAQLKKLRIMEWPDLATPEVHWITQMWPTSLEAVRVLTIQHISLEARALLKSRGIKVIETQHLET